MYKLYIGPWGVPPSEYINLDSPDNIEEGLRQKLRSVVEALIHLGSLTISSENTDIYNWISSLGSDRFNVLYNQKYYRILIVSEEYEVPRKSVEFNLWMAVVCLLCYSIGITAVYVYKESKR